MLNATDSEQRRQTELLELTKEFGSENEKLGIRVFDKDNRDTSFEETFLKVNQRRGLRISSDLDMKTTEMS